MDDHFSPMRHGCRLRACRSQPIPLSFCLENPSESVHKKQGQTNLPTAGTCRRKIPFAGASVFTTKQYDQTVTLSFKVLDKFVVGERNFQYNRDKYEKRSGNDTEQIGKWKA